MEIDGDLLEPRKFALRRATAILPDGTPFDAPADNEGVAQRLASGDRPSLATPPNLLKPPLIRRFQPVHIDEPDLVRCCA